MKMLMKMRRMVPAALLFTAAVCRPVLAQDVAPPTVTDVTPLPGAVLTSAPSSIIVTFSEEVEASTVSTDTFRLVRSGGDGTFGDGNEVEIVPASVTLDGTGTQATMDLTGVTVANDDYQVTVSGAEAPTAGLVGCWKFDEGSGSTAKDSSPKGNHGTVHGATWTAGKVGGCLGFTGSDSDYVDIPNESDYDLANAVSYAAWVKAAPAPPNSFMGVVTKGDNMNLQSYQLENRFMWRTVGLSQVHLVETAYCIDDTWHHLVATYDGTEKRFYVDGALDASAAATGSIDTGDYPIMIGRNGSKTGFAFKGLIDDVRIYDRALSAAEAAALARPLPVTDLAANPLDGEYSGSLPSGDGTAGGDFVCTFTLNVPLPKVEAVTPAPGTILTEAPASVDVTFTKAMAPVTVSTDTFRLVRSGGDGTFTDGNEVEIVAKSVTLDGAGTQATMELTGVTMPNDDYQVTVGGGGPTTGLVAHWKFDEGAEATVAVDSSSSGYDGTNMGSLTTGVLGRLGNAYSFDGVNDYVDCGAGIPDRPAVITQTAWVKTAEDGVMLTKRHSGGFPWPTLMVASGKAAICVDDTNYKNSILSTTAVDDNVWHHVVGIKDGAVYSIYVDGLLENSTTDTRPMSGTGNLHIGHHGSWASVPEPFAWFAGLVDDVRIYNRALLSSEVTALASPAPITDLSANPLDGEYTGSLPSGDGTPGGDFVCTFAIENVTAPASVTDLSLSAGDESVTVAWRNPFDTDFAGVVVLRRVGAAPTGTPTDGVTYDVGNALGDGFVVYVGTGTAGIPGDRSSWENTGLLNDTEYHYTIFAYDEAMNYSPGVSGAAIPAVPEGGGDGGLCSPGSSASPVLLALAFALAALASRLPGTPCRRGIAR